MPNVLLMPTLQIRDPVCVLVLLKTDDLLFQCLMISAVAPSASHSGLLRIYPVLVNRRETGFHQKMMESVINQQIADEITRGRSTR